MKNMSADQALELLRTGNERFVAQKRIFPNQSTERRSQLVLGQQPFAVVLGCSDSRVPPEIIFDQGIGDLFVIRVAGNIIDDAVIGSMEYAVDHLHVNLILVLGHQKCGAVEATVKGGEPHGHVVSLVAAIKPAVEKAKGLQGDILDNSIRLHMESIVEQLRLTKPVISEGVKTGQVRVEGGYYHLDSGRVEILSIK